MKKQFKTIHQPATTELIEKKSRFIANVSPISIENDALSFINHIKKLHNKASHNCFAYILSEPQIIRFSDDGEPSGTAGKPILDVLIGEKIENAIIVITRYFGGTLLGAGGLVRAYGKTAKLGILEAKIVVMDLYTIVYVITDYSLIGKLQHDFSANNYIVIDTIYTDVVQFNLYIPTDFVNNFINNIINITNNNAKCSTGDTLFIKIIDGSIV